MLFVAHNVGIIGLTFFVKRLHISSAFCNCCYILSSANIHFYCWLSNKIKKFLCINGKMGNYMEHSWRWFRLNSKGEFAKAHEKLAISLTP